jgi:DNA-binding beta-propeller fold protein YncE
MGARLWRLVTFAVAAFALAPAGAQASVTSGSLSQLAAPSNCIGEKALSSEGNACGTLVEEGTHNVFQVQISPDGRNAYSVSISGDLIEYERNLANGALKAIGCLTAGSDKCAGENVVSNVPDIGRPSALAVSPDGKNVYVAGTEKHAVVELERNEATGLLTPMSGGKACISEEVGGQCEVKGATWLNEPYGVTVSPDGANVYVTAVKGEAVAQFARTVPEGGSPGVLAVLSGAQCIGGPGSGCPVNTVKGMFEPIGIVVSPDGKNVYVAAGAGNSEGAVIAFEREGGGALRQLPGEEGCVSEKIAGCATATALQGSEDLAISPDGANVYATSGRKNALVELKRNSETGALTQLGGAEDECVTTETIAGCKKASSVGLTRGVAISPHGEDVYVGSASENGVAAFSRGAEGALTPLTGGFECVTSNASGCGTHNKLLGLQEARRVAISPDGTNLYVAGQKAGAIVELARTVTPTVTSVNLTAGSPSGGEMVRIKGSGFSEDGKGVTVTFGTSVATATVVSGTTILAEAPAQAEGLVPVTVKNEAGTSTESLSDVFTYTVDPEVIGVAPAIGSEAGGTTVTVAGERFNRVTAVRFGSTPATSFTVESPEEIVAKVPPGTGAVDVTVETADGSSTASVADSFTYVDGTVEPAPSGGLILQGYCEGLGYQSVTEQRGGISGNGFAYDNWACVSSGGVEVPIANAGSAPSMQEACVEANTGHTVYAYPSEINSAFAWGCYTVIPPPEKEKSEESVQSSPPVVHLASELAPPIAPVSGPKLAKTGNVAPVAGTVSVRLPGSKAFVPLSTLTQIPFGTTIEATHGKVKVTAAEPGGRTETGVYFGGQFKLTQERNGTVVATLTGGNFSVCPTARERAHRASAGGSGAAVGAGVARSAHATASGKHSVRKLWTNAHGKFSTRGNYAAGAVQGTEWLTDDLCEGTLIRVTRDKVAVTNLVNHKHLVVKAGRHYLAKAP